MKSAWLDPFFLRGTIVHTNTLIHKQQTRPSILTFSNSIETGIMNDFANAVPPWVWLRIFLPLFHDRAPSGPSSYATANPSPKCLCACLLYSEWPPPSWAFTAVSTHCAPPWSSTLWASLRCSTIWLTPNGPIGVSPAAPSIALHSGVPRFGPSGKSPFPNNHDCSSRTHTPQIVLPCF